MNYAPDFAKTLPTKTCHFPFNTPMPVLDMTDSPLDHQLEYSFWSREQLSRNLALSYQKIRLLQEHLIRCRMRYGQDSNTKCVHIANRLLNILEDHPYEMTRAHIPSHKQPKISPPPE